MRKAGYVLKRLLLLIFVVCISILISACSPTNEKKQAAVKSDPLSLQVLAVHDRDDVEMDEYHLELYEGIKHTIQQNQEMGLPGEFSLQSYRVFENYQGPFYVFLGINRMDKPIKNVSFEMDLGDNTGNMLWKNDTIYLSEEETGVIAPNKVVPIMLPITDEIVEKAETVDFDNLKMEMTNFEYEEMKN